MESALLCVVACMVAIITTQSSLALFNELTGKQISPGEVVNGEMIFYGVIIFIIVVLLTGLYPAYILSNFKPSEVLYNKQRLTGRNLLGKGLVVVQFSLAVFLVIATVTYYSQMNYVRTKDLGYAPFRVIRSNIPGDRDTKPIQAFLKNELAKEPTIELLSFGGDRSFAVDVAIGEQHVQATNTVVDENYLPVMGIGLKSGRNFSTAFPADKENSLLVNEAFMKNTEPAGAIGKNVIITDGPEKTTRKIIGIVEDYHYSSLKEPIRPMVLTMSDWLGNNILVKFEKSKHKQAMNAWEKAYKKAMPAAVFQAAFLDEINAREYRQEQRWQKIISIAALLSILICSLGLFGLSHLASHQRTKEIGIRKILGASIPQLIAILSKEFVQLVVIAFFIAAPLAWLVMHNWLQNFAYRADISWWWLLVTAAGMLFIALLTISFQAIKAAIANPVESLRTE